MKKTKNTVTKKCLTCGKNFTRYKSHARQTGAKCCSNRCANTGKRSHAWQPNLKVEQVGDKSYMTLHRWVRRHKVKPKKCEHCGCTKRLAWANVDHKYKRDLGDYVALCSSCHTYYDVEFNGKVIRNQSGVCKLRTTP